MNGKECMIQTFHSRPIRRAAWIGLLASAIACAAANAATVRAWPTAVVVDDQIRIADVCELDGFVPEDYERVRALVVAAAPKPGGSTLVQIRDLKDALAAGGVNLAQVLVKGASRCAITRPLVPVPEVKAEPAVKAAAQTAAPPQARTLRDAVEAFFHREIGRMDGTVRVQFGRTAQPILDLCEPEFSFDVRRRTGRLLGMAGIDVTVRRDGDVVQIVPMMVTVSFAHPVVVARRGINAKAAVQPDDVQVIDMTFTQFSQIGLSNAAEAIGQRAKRFIAAGDTIHARNLEPVPIVHRGQIVQVHSLEGGVKIVTAAKAMQSGAYGASIELRSHDGRRRMITAVVTGPGRAEIRPPAPREGDGKILLAGVGE
jgi:flagella basal body P-ring formation protein FlgA